MKIGIFGGSFDPPHRFHRKLCENAAKEFSLEKIIIIPTATPPHKDLYGTPAADRFAMAAKVFSGADFSVSDIEQKGEATYTYQTLGKLKKIYPEDELYLIIGGDSMMELGTWKSPEAIASAAKIIVVPRGKARTKEEAAAREFSAKYEADIVFSEEAMPDISSTNLRSLLEFDLGVSEFLDEAVINYIKENSLYSKYRNLIKKLRTYLDDEKYIHSAYTAAMGDKISRGLKLSRENRERVYIACILHDCAKRMTGVDAAEYGFVADAAIYQKSMHGLLGEVVARKDFGISDTQILEAIRCHTYAAPDMGLLAKILYFADFCEESREFNNKKYIENLTAENIEDRFRQLLQYRYKLLLKTKKPQEINPHTKAAYDFYFPKK